MRRILVADDVTLQALPPTVRTAALAELDRVYAFVGHTPGEQAMAAQVLRPLEFPAEMDFSDAVVRLVSDEALPAHLRSAFRQQVAYVSEWLEALGTNVEKPSENHFFDADPERLGTASFIKSVSEGFAICIMASFVTLPGSQAAYVEESTRSSKDEIDRRRNDIEGDPAAMTRYFASAQALYDAHDELLHDNATNPGQWPTEDQQTFGVFLGRAMAHEARHVLVLPHAESGLGAETANLLDDATYGEFSPDDQVEIVNALHAFERDQAGKRLVPAFPETVRSNADAFPF